MILFLIIFLSSLFLGTFGKIFWDFFYLRRTLCGLANLVISNDLSRKTEIKKAFLLDKNSNRDFIFLENILNKDVGCLRNYTEVLSRLPVGNQNKDFLIKSIHERITKDNFSEFLLPLENLLLTSSEKIFFLENIWAADNSFCFYKNSFCSYYAQYKRIQKKLLIQLFLFSESKIIDLILCKKNKLFQ